MINNNETNDNDDENNDDDDIDSNGNTKSSSRISGCSWYCTISINNSGNIIIVFAVVLVVIVLIVTTVAAIVALQVIGGICKKWKQLYYYYCVSGLFNVVWASLPKTSMLWVLSLHTFYLHLLINQLFSQFLSFSRFLIDCRMPEQRFHQIYLGVAHSRKSTYQ